MHEENSCCIDPAVRTVEVHTYCNSSGNVSYGSPHLFTWLNSSTTLLLIHSVTWRLLLRKWLCPCHICPISWWCLQKSLSHMRTPDCFWTTPSGHSHTNAMTTSRNPFSLPHYRSPDAWPNVEHLGRRWMLRLSIRSWNRYIAYIVGWYTVKISHCVEIGVRTHVEIGPRKPDDIWESTITWYCKFSDVWIHLLIIASVMVLFNSSRDSQRKRRDNVNFYNDLPPSHRNSSTTHLCLSRKLEKFTARL